MRVSRLFFIHFIVVVDKEKSLDIYKCPNQDPNIKNSFKTQCCKPDMLTKILFI